MMFEIRKKLDGAVQAYNDAAGSLEARVLVSARRLRELQVTTGDEIPPAEPVERTPRLLKQMELIEEAQGPGPKAQAGP
jgi:DNA recombination protein RmuC